MKQSRAGKKLSAIKSIYCNIILIFNCHHFLQPTTAYVQRMKLARGLIDYSYRKLSIGLRVAALKVCWLTESIATSRINRAGMANSHHCISTR